MTVEHIAHMDWDVKTLSSGEKLYTNTTEGITGVAVIGSPGQYSTVIMVDDENSPEYVYNNADNSDWNSPRVWDILESLAENMYDVEQDMREDDLDRYYSTGQDDDSYDEYDPYDMEYDTDLHNEW
jgi:hypothetical protein